MKKECNKKNGLFHVIYDLSYYTSMFKELYMHTITAIRTINASNRAFKIAKSIFPKVKTQKEKRSKIYVSFLLTALVILKSFIIL